MKRFTGPAARAGLLLVAACLALAGCSSSSKQHDDGEPEWLNPFADDAKPFKESEVALPATPKDADLVPFSVSDAGNFDFAVDTKSVSVGKDNVVRYTVVITSTSGARNVSYEGMRCDAFERKIYATMPQGAKDWIPNRGGTDDWQRMQTRQRNSYAATLATDYFCEGRTVAGKPEKLVRDLRAYAPIRR